MKNKDSLQKNILLGLGNIYKDVENFLLGSYRMSRNVDESNKDKTIKLLILKVKLAGLKKTDLSLSMKEGKEDSILSIKTKDGIKFSDRVDIDVPYEKGTVVVKASMEDGLLTVETATRVKEDDSVSIDIN